MGVRNRRARNARDGALLVTWRTGAELNGNRLPEENVSVDIERNRIEVTVPLEPGEETWRHYAITGLWDANSRAFKQLQTQATEDQPGGGMTDEPPVFNVGFRDNDQEPNNGWRDGAQSEALANRDISRFHADIDFDVLRSGGSEYNVPETGFITRIYASHYQLGFGIEPGAGYVSAPTEIEPTLLAGRIHPYSIYIPDSYDPDDSAPLTVYLHGAGGNHTGVSDTLLRQLGEQRGAIMYMVNGRGGNIPYQNESELDVFEGLADATTRYNVDLDRMTVTGYSMGGYGTLKLTTQYPDLFSKGFAVASTPGNDPIENETDDQPSYHELTRISDNCRTAEFLMWHGSNDAIVYPFEPEQYHQELVDRGYRHEYDVFFGQDHLSFAVIDEWGRGGDFLRGATAERNPPQVTYRRVPEFDDERFDIAHDKAHWVSDIEVGEDADSGLVDVRSGGYGESPPTVENIRGTGTDPSPHLKRGIQWAETIRDPPSENSLDVELKGVSEVTLWVVDAGLDPQEPIKLTVDSTSPTKVILNDGNRSTAVNLPAGQSMRTVSLQES